MNGPEQENVRITIPSMEEHDELRNYQDIGECDMMHFHLLNHLHMRIKMYMSIEFYIKARIRTDFECKFEQIK